MTNTATKWWVGGNVDGMKTLNGLYYDDNKQCHPNVSIYNIEIIIQ